MLRSFLTWTLLLIYAFAGEVESTEIPVLAGDRPGLWATVELSPVGEFVAYTPMVKGVVRLKKGKLTATPVEVALMTIKTGKELRDEHLKEKLWVQKFPVATLRRINILGKNQGSGELFVRGKKQRIFFEYTLNQDNLVAHFILPLKTLGLEEISYLGVTVENEVKVDVRLPLKRFAD